MSRNVAISGAAGFVGRRLVTRLIELGYEVIALDLVDPKITGSEFHFFDIGDDLSWKSRKNYTLLHMIERIKLYNEEGFKYKLVRISTDGNPKGN